MEFILTVWSLTPLTWSTNHDYKSIYGTGTSRGRRFIVKADKRNNHRGCVTEYVLYFKCHIIYNNRSVTEYKYIFCDNCLWWDFHFNIFKKYAKHIVCAFIEIYTPPYTHTKKLHADYISLIMKSNILSMIFLYICICSARLTS